MYFTQCYPLHVLPCYKESVRGVLSVVAGQFLWLNVYRMTQGHISCQFILSLGARRNRGNLFSLARLSSHTETVFVLFGCIAPLGFLTSSFLLSPLLSSTSSHFVIATTFFSVPCLYLSLFPRSFLFSSPPSFFPYVNCHTGIRERSCCAVYLPAWLQGFVSK